MFDEHEPAEFQLTPDLAAIERQLARMTPAAPRIDRDRLMFEAGKAASRPERPAYIGEPSRLAAKFWPAATAMMTAASVLLATMLVWQRQSTQLAAQSDGSPKAIHSLDVPRNETSLAGSKSSTSITWPTIAQPSSGYLGDRNFALVRGVNAFESRTSKTDSAESHQTEQLKPLQRKLLNDFLPSS